jgi:hypothetical protein
MHVQVLRSPTLTSRTLWGVIQLSSTTTPLREGSGRSTNKFRGRLSPYPGRTATPMAISQLSTVKWRRQRKVTPRLRKAPSSYCLPCCEYFFLLFQIVIWTAFSANEKDANVAYPFKNSTSVCDCFFVQSSQLICHDSSIRRARHLFGLVCVFCCTAMLRC